MDHMKHYVEQAGSTQMIRNRLRNSRRTWMALSFVTCLLCGAHAAFGASGEQNKSLPPFVDDPSLPGGWISVDFVSAIDHFVPGQRQWKGGELFLKNLLFYAEGKGAFGWCWSKGWAWFQEEAVPGKYEIRAIDGKDYLFLEWINGDVTIRGEKPSFYVLERGIVQEETPKMLGTSAESNRGITLLIVIINSGCALVFILLSLPLTMQMIPRNGMYGFRLQKAFESETLWSDINAYGAKQMILWSLGIIVAGVGCYFLENALGSSCPEGLMPVLQMCIFCGFLAIAVLRTYIYASRLPSAK